MSGNEAMFALMLIVAVKQKQASEKLLKCVKMIKRGMHPV